MKKKKVFSKLSGKIPIDFVTISKKEPKSKKQRLNFSQMELF